jgi:endosialidase-like protein
MMFTTNGSERLRMTSAGLVGIGTTSPNNRLSVLSGTTGYNNAATYAVELGSSANTAKKLVLGYDATIDAGVISAVNLGVAFDRNLVLNPVAGNVGIATTTPWRTLSVTGTVGFDGLTGSTGAGSLCLDSNKQVVYNSGSDNCLSSMRATKHDITLLSLNDLGIIDALQPVSFVYNQGDGRVRYGFIAEDTANVDAHLATYDASGTVSGIDDRSIIAVLVSAVKALAATVTSFAENFSSHFIHGDTVEADKLCVDDVCVTRDEFLRMTEAADAQSLGGAEAAGGSSAPGAGGGADATSSTTAQLALNGNNPAEWQLNQPWQDNLGALFTHEGENETVYSTSTVDTTTSGTTTIDYWAFVPATQDWLHTTREVAIPAPANDNQSSTSSPANDNPPPLDDQATGTDGATTTDASSTAE